MASLRERILGRVRNWNTLATPLDRSANDPVKNLDRVIQSVDKSALARRIRFQGDGFVLELLAGFGRVHEARVKIGSESPQDFAFEDSDSDADAQSKTEKLNYALSRLAGQMEGEAPNFEFLNYHFADGVEDGANVVGWRCEEAVEGVDQRVIEGVAFLGPCEGQGGDSAFGLDLK